MWTKKRRNGSGKGKSLSLCVCVFEGVYLQKLMREGVSEARLHRAFSSINIFEFFNISNNVLTRVISHGTS